MKLNRVTTLCIGAFLAILLSACTKPIESFFEGIETSPDETYGYTAENPIKVGYKLDGIHIQHVFVARLRTQQGDALTTIAIAAVKDPLHKNKILDCFILVPESTNDTLRLYFDVYHKERIFIPKGLQYVAPLQEARSA